MNYCGTHDQLQDALDAVCRLPPGYWPRERRPAPAPNPRPVYRERFITFSHTIKLYDHDLARLALISRGRPSYDGLRIALHFYLSAAIWRYRKYNFYLCRGTAPRSAILIDSVTAPLPIPWLVLSAPPPLQPRPTAIVPWRRRIQMPSLRVKVSLYEHDGHYLSPMLEWAEQSEEACVDALRVTAMAVRGMDAGRRLVASRVRVPDGRLIKLEPRQHLKEWLLKLHDPVVCPILASTTFHVPPGMATGRRWNARLRAAFHEQIRSWQVGDGSANPDLSTPDMSPPTEPEGPP